MTQDVHYCKLVQLFLLSSYNVHRVKERDALLKQLKDCLIEDSKEYFKRIKPKIVEVSNSFCYIFLTIIPFFLFVS